MASLFEPVLPKVSACPTVPQVRPAVEKGSLGLEGFSTKAVFFLVCFLLYKNLLYVPFCSLPALPEKPQSNK